MINKIQTKPNRSSAGVNGSRPKAATATCKENVRGKTRVLVFGSLGTIPLEELVGSEPKKVSLTIVDGVTRRANGGANSKNSLGSGSTVGRANLRGTGKYDVIVIAHRGSWNPKSLECVAEIGKAQLLKANGRLVLTFSMKPPTLTISNVRAIGLGELDIMFPIEGHIWAPRGIPAKVMAVFENQGMALDPEPLELTQSPRAIYPRVTLKFRRTY